MIVSFLYKYLCRKTWMGGLGLSGKYQPFIFIFLLLFSSCRHHHHWKRKFHFERKIFGSSFSIPYAAKHSFSRCPHLIHHCLFSEEFVLYWSIAWGTVFKRVFGEGLWGGSIWESQENICKKPSLGTGKSQVLTWSLSCPKTLWCQWDLEWNKGGRDRG